MLEDRWRDSIIRADLNLSGQVACNKLLIFVSTIFAGISLLLAVALGYVLGQRNNFLASAIFAGVSPFLALALGYVLGGQRTTTASQEVRSARHEWPLYKES